MMRKHLLGAVAALAVMGTAAPAQAQMQVIDRTAVVQAISTARNTLRQIQEAQRLYQSFNEISNIRNISDLLDQDILRSSLPDGMNNSIDLVSGDLSDLGALGNRAQGLLSGHDLTLSGMDRMLGRAGRAFEESAQQTAANQAYGEYMLEASEATGEGLGQLSDGLSQSTSMRQSTDIAARAAIENAAVNNRMMQMMAADRARGAQRTLIRDAEYARTQRQNTADADGNWRPELSGN